MKESLLNKLQEYNKNHWAFHMPGHMRNTSIIGGEYLLSLGGDIDITEIDSFDDLYHPEGVLKESMTMASKLWGAEKSFMLVNGSTAGNMAALYSVTKPGSKVLIAKNCHKSIYHGVEAFGLNHEYLYPEFDRELGIYLGVKAEEVERALKANPDCEAVVITSPTYEGIVSDIEKIASIVHSYGAKLIVDEAHGGHLGLSEFFPQSSLRLGGDIVTQSFHKTLLSLTQTAMVHIGDKTIYPMMRKSLEMFQTSSPSYILMASMDSCIRLLREQRDELFKNWNACLDYIYENAKELKHIELLGNLQELPVYALDKAKVVILTHKCEISGFQLMDILRREFNIELEMASFNHAVAYTGLGLNMEMADKLIHSLKEIDGKVKPKKKKPMFTASLKSIKKFSIGEATALDGEETELKNASGLVSGEYVWAYPPGIPILTPGEIITREILEIFNEYSKKNVDLRFSKSQKNDRIYTVRL